MTMADYNSQYGGAGWRTYGPADGNDQAGGAGQGVYGPGYSKYLTKDGTHDWTEQWTTGGDGADAPRTVTLPMSHLVDLIGQSPNEYAPELHDKIRGLYPQWPAFPSSDRAFENKPPINGGVQWPTPATSAKNKIMQGLSGM